MEDKIEAFLQGLDADYQYLLIGTAEEENSVGVGFSSRDTAAILIAAFLSTEIGREIFSDAISMLADDYSSQNVDMMFMESYMKFLRQRLGVGVSIKIDNPDTPCNKCVFFNEEKLGFGRCNVLQINIDGTEKNCKNAKVQYGCCPHGQREYVTKGNQDTDGQTRISEADS